MLLVKSWQAGGPTSLQRKASKEGTMNTWKYIIFMWDTGRLSGWLHIIATVKGKSASIDKIWHSPHGLSSTSDYIFFCFVPGKSQWVQRAAGATYGMKTITYVQLWSCHTQLLQTNCKNVTLTCPFLKKYIYLLVRVWSIMSHSNICKVFFFVLCWKWCIIYHKCVW